MQFNDISGEGGGKGGGGSPRAAVEDPNTLKSEAIVKVVEVIAEGEIRGLYGATPGQGVYLNDTALQNADGTYNFTGVEWDYRKGLPTQSPILGNSGTEAEVLVNAPVVFSTPLTRTTSDDQVDAVRVTIQLPQGLSSQNTTNGDLSGSEVSYKIETKLTASGAWATSNTFTISGKTRSPYERSHYITRPSGTGTWDIRVSRLTADSTSSALVNLTSWARFTEINDVKLEYPNTAYVGFKVTTDSVGNAIPRRSYLIDGQIIKVPSNYTTSEVFTNGEWIYTRGYAGLWDGTFKLADTFTPHNPVWALYDLLTNARYGMGQYITEAMIDKWSFYDCARYCDEFVPAQSGGQEPRFMFDVVINDRREAINWIVDVASAMRAQLLYVNGIISLVQDRPADPVKLISKANVIDGVFSYKSTGLFDRNTAYNVTYADKNNRYLPSVATVYDTTGVTKFGYVVQDLVAWGATTPGQAIRAGRWALETGLIQTDIVNFKMSMNGFTLLPFDIISVYDEDLADKVGAGRVVASTANTVTLDRDIDTSTHTRLDVMLADGKTLESKTIASVSGRVVTVTSNFSQVVLVDADYFYVSTAEPRQFRILAIRQEDANIVSVEAVIHDPTKYARIDTDSSGPPIKDPTPTVTTQPTNLMVTESAMNVDNTVRRNLLISWNRPVLGIATSYTLMWKRDNGPWTTVNGITSLSYDLVNMQTGLYQILLYAISNYNLTSPAANASYTMTSTNGGTSTLNAPTTLVEQNNGTNAFTTNDLNFKWTNPASNATVLSSTLRDFEVRIINVSNNAVLRTYYVPPVDAGSTANSSYTYSMNLADTNNVPSRSVKVEVRCRDTNGNLSAAVQTTFTNAAPAVPSNLAVFGAIQGTKITFTLPSDPDFLGVLIWGSTTSGFTPNSSNLLYDGSDSYVTFNGLTDSTAYYYRVAAYDSFGKSYDGTGLNLSAQISAITTVAPGIPRVATLPGTGVEGDVVFNTTNGQLYRWHNGAWTAAVPTINLTGAIADTQIEAGTINGNKIQAGTITANELAANSITAGKIAAGTVSASEIVAGTITSTQIASNTILGDNIAAGTISGNKIVANTITAGLIDSRGLTIKDDNGNIILSAGNPLAAAYITPDAGWLNSALTPSISAAATAASTAQTTANSASTAASTAQTTANSASTAASTAQSTANSASSAAATAQSTANGAVTTANAAATAAAAKLNKSAADILTGTITLSTTGMILAGSTTTGVYISPAGIVGKKAGVTTFSVSGTTGDAIFAGNLSGNQFTTGSMTGYAWPAAGTYGTYLGPSGLLIGNANNGKYLQVTADGNLYAPGLQIQNGLMTISGLNVIDTLQIKDQAVTVPVNASLAADTAVSNTVQEKVVMTATINAGGSPIWITSMGYTTNGYTSGGSNGSASETACIVRLYVDGALKVSSVGSAVNSATFTHPYAISTSISGGTSHTIEIRIIGQLMQGIVVTNLGKILAGSTLFAIGTKK